MIAAGTNHVVVALDGTVGIPDPGSLPLVVIAIRERNGVECAAADLIVDADDTHLDDILDTIDTYPIAATSLAVLLRGSGSLSVDRALAAESAVYSLLQSGPEFAAWRASAPARTRPARPDDRPAVAAERIDDERTGDELRIQLDRPHRHNAFSRSMRDALTEMLAVAITDPSIERVVLSGRGPSFCSGGDLGEFGSFDDPATAHRTRLSRSPARLIHRLADRLTVQLHGNCLGAGIELAAFARHVRAAPDSAIALPELGLGLIPGAGGTVSIPRRIGRQLTSYLALSQATITAETALAWGLVDEIA